MPGTGKRSSTRFERPPREAWSSARIQATPTVRGSAAARESLDRAEVERLVRSQVDSLAELAELAGVSLRFVKPHGALYNQAQREEATASGVVDAVKALRLPVLGQPGGQVEALCRAAGVRFVAEGFADRRYQEDGRLVPRGEPGAILDDPEEIAAQVLRLVRSGTIDTLCLHGDDPRAVALADRVREVLRQAGIPLRSFV